ncbi:DUF5995 family protein [Parafilimonas sp.]|jgi:hypothetical protein|uniref:DUF5995 family protein n=1 Tax=Parafilimonas sp. TaxID=1969739 RepID=UPI003F80C4D7
MAASTIKEIIEQLNEIVDHSIATGSRMGYFAVLYRCVTESVAQKINEGYFDDGPRMEKLDVLFANRYLDAYNTYAAGNACTTSWQLAFDATKQWKPMVMHHLLLGMNAHISLDLGIATATISPGDKINDIHNDFLKINALLIAMINDVKLKLFSMWPLSKLIAKLNTGDLENSMAGFSMIVAREAAWQVALAYAPLLTENAQQAYITGRDKKVNAFGNRILNPGAWSSTVMYALRLFETGTTASKINKLNKEVTTA